MKKLLWRPAYNQVSDKYRNIKHQLPLIKNNSLFVDENSVHLLYSVRNDNDSNAIMRRKVNLEETDMEYLYLLFIVFYLYNILLAIAHINYIIVVLVRCHVLYAVYRSHY